MEFQNAIREFIPSEYYLPVLLLLFLIWLLIAAFFVPKWKAERPNFSLTIVVAVLLLIVMRSNLADRSSWMIGLLPTLLVAYQAFYLWNTQPKEVQRQETKGMALQKEDYDRVYRGIASQFSLKTLFIRYGFPASLLAIMTIF